MADQVDRPALPLPSAQLLLYRFGPDAEFEGQLVGALERIESGGALRILDALFVRSDAETGELEAIAAHGDGAGRIVAPLLDFRLDPARRAARPSGPSAAIAAPCCATSERSSRRARRWPSCSSITPGRVPWRTPWRGPAARR